MHYIKLESSKRKPHGTDCMWTTTSSSSHLDVVGVSDQLVDVRRLPAQLRHVVLQDDAFASAAVQAVGRFSSCCAWRVKV